MPTGPTASTDTTRPKVSIVLATLNERDNLAELLPRIVSQPLPPFELLIVDDGSSDGTRAFVTDFAHADARVRLILHEGKQTTLRAQCQGIDAARGEFVVVMDADLQHPPERIPEMIRALEGGATLVVASRYAPGGTPGPRTVGRTVISRGAEWIAKLLLPEAGPVSDPVSGFFAFRQEIFIPLNPLYRGYKLLLFVLVMNRERPVAEVGFRFEARLRGASKVVNRFEFVRVFLIEAVLARRLHTALLRGVGANAPTPDPRWVVGAGTRIGAPPRASPQVATETRSSGKRL